MVQAKLYISQAMIRAREKSDIVVVPHQLMRLWYFVVVL